LKIELLKKYAGVTLMAIGVLLLVVCRLAGWQSNVELLTALALVLGGFVWYVRGFRQGQKY
jgi:hypothetical protein